MVEWNGTLKLPGWTLGWSLKAALKRREGTPVIGPTNKVGHFFVPFFDYDIREEKFINAEVRSLQEEYLLGDAFLFRTGKGFHVIFLDLLRGEEWLEVLGASNCDEEYKAVPRLNGARAWVLRASPKRNGAVDYVKVIPGYLGRTLSRPHYDYLLKRGVPLKDLERLRIFTTKAAESLIWAAYEA